MYDAFFVFSQLVPGWRSQSGVRLDPFGRRFYKSLAEGESR